MVNLLRFRAWHKTWEEIGKVKRIRFDDDGNVTTVLFYGKDFGTNTKIDEIELMQSTGLFDKNGKDIFEGDIILWTYWDGFEDSGSAKIIFDNGMFKLLDIYTEKEVRNNLFDCDENCDIYIQGNIYENPELLEVTK